VGGAETLLKNLALHAAARGVAVDFLTTCAQSHFTWENTLPAGVRHMDGMDVHFFPVDARDVGTFLRIQQAIDRGRPVSEEEEILWLRNGVNSAALLAHLDRHAADYRAILLGPYLFGLTWFTALAHPERSLLVPCLHDEPFAKLACMKRLFAETPAASSTPRPNANSPANCSPIRRQGAHRRHGARFFEPIRRLSPGAAASPRPTSSIPAAASRSRARRSSATTCTPSANAPDAT
jgi:hypothetical protein